MIGILFHGPEVFDSGWAKRIVQALSPAGPLRCVLAGTMGRTAAIDSGLPDIECPGTQPSQILNELQNKADQVIFANYGVCHTTGKSSMSVPVFILLPNCVTSRLRVTFFY